MSLVNQEKLNYFAQGLYSKIKANFDAKGSATTAETNAKEYADGLNTAMDGRVTTLETTVGNAESGLVKDVAVLKGDKNTEGSVAYQVAQIVAGADASYDTLKEIADWIMSDQTGAAKMANDIKANADAITDLETLVGTIPAEATATDIVGYIAEYVQAQLTASDLSQYAKAEDFNALKDVVGDETKGLVKGLADVTTKATDNESAIATLNGADTVEGSVAKAVKDAKEYTDTKDLAMSTRVDDIEAGIKTNADAITQLRSDVDDTIANLSDVHLDAEADNKYDNTTGNINLYLNDRETTNVEFAKWAKTSINDDRKVLYKLTTDTEYHDLSSSYLGYYTTTEEPTSDNDYTITFTEDTNVTADNFAAKVEAGLWVSDINIFYSHIKEFYCLSTYNNIAVKCTISDTEDILNHQYNSISRAIYKETDEHLTYYHDTKIFYYQKTVKDATKIEVPVSELKAAITAIGVETNTENSVAATGIYARLESLESVMGTASVKDDHGNVVTPATGVQKQIEDLQASQNEIITEAQIDEMINGLV